MVGNIIINLQNDESLHSKRVNEIAAVHLIHQKITLETHLSHSHS
jgi:hypothetical protein